ncbi:MAG: glycine cleavage system protein GcvH [Blastocatellia bacterium]|nr:glycine cleavage system protein GcvH [Blastocatellia bacterium]
MGNYPDNLLYTKDHEWLRVDGERATVGITYFAQSELGDIVYVELPRVGDRLSQQEPLGSVESVKTVSEVFMPVSGLIEEINEKLADSPELVNDDPYGDGWMIVIKIDNPSELDALMSVVEYEDLLSEGKEH